MVLLPIWPRPRGGAWREVPNERPAPPPPALPSPGPSELLSRRLVGSVSGAGSGATESLGLVLRREVLAIPERFQAVTGGSLPRALQTPGSAGPDTSAQLFGYLCRLQTFTLIPREAIIC
ncbi:hypothetical protein KIL84_004123 [Mauremys mutica]|uniref:Uncharacterized protein n=1 Tax=Mauremys mutica TaxID=74926 RepID=A0A9D3XNC3_9SAUR|nr:hypothetical protein KIL84_004123 [Mauremys mutica]